jgi:hypothetical protein
MVLALVSIGCLVSILSILFELSTAKQVSDSLKTLHLALTGATLVVSWLLLPTAFTMHYAHQFYRQGAQQDPLPLCFPATLRSLPIGTLPISRSPSRWLRKLRRGRRCGRGAQSRSTAIGDFLCFQSGDPGAVD